MDQDEDDDDDDASIDRFSLNGLLAAPEIPSNFGIYFFFSVIVVGRCLKKKIAAAPNLLLVFCGAANLPQRNPTRECTSNGRVNYSSMRAGRRSSFLAGSQGGEGFFLSSQL